jgi:hypothetical protein
VLANSSIKNFLAICINLIFKAWHTQKAKTTEQLFGRMVIQ